MSARVLVTCLLAGASLAAAGCASQPASDGADDAPQLYVESAQELMIPVGELASAIAQRVERPAAAPPPRRDLQRIVRRADESLSAFRAVDPVDDALRAQQSRTAAGYETLVGSMEPVVDALSQGVTGPALVDATDEFFMSLDALPAAAADLP